MYKLIYSYHRREGKKTTQKLKTKSITSRKNSPVKKAYNMSIQITDKKNRPQNQSVRLTS